MKILINLHEGIKAMALLCSKYKRWVLVLLLMVLGLGGVIHWQGKYGNVLSFVQEALASDIKNFKHPLFENIERVYVHVDYQISMIKEKDLPKPLRRASLEKMLKELYQKRFSSKDCKEILEGTNPYSCDDQSVIVIPMNEYNSVASREARKKPGTLNINLKISIRDSAPNFDDPSLKEGLVAFYLIQDRPEADFPIDWEVSIPFAFPVTQTEESIRTRLYKIITERIK